MNITRPCRCPRWVTFALLCLSLAVVHQGRAQTEETWDGSVEQRLDGFITVWSEAKYNFPFFDQRPGLDWDAAMRKYLPRVIAAESIDSYYAVLREFAALLHDGHTGVNPPGGPLNPANDWPPLEVQVVDGRFLVVRSARTSEIIQNRIYPGVEILEVEDVPVADYFQQHVVRFESRGAPHADQAIGIYRLLLGPRDSLVSIRVRDPDSAERAVELTRNSTTESGGRFYPRILEWYLTESPVEFSQQDDGILYIRISNFGSEEVVSSFLEEFDRTDWTDVDGVILDLRFNPGGDDRFAWPIIACFVSEATESPIWRSPKYVPAKLAWGDGPEWEQGFLGEQFIQPRAGTRFEGPLVILTGHSTFSTAEDFIIPLDYSDRAVLVGETTAGSTGNPKRVPLPGGGEFRVVTLRTLYPDGTEWVGAGIRPDYEVQLSLQDVLDGRDAALLKGIEVIGDLIANQSSLEPVAENPADQPTPALDDQ